MQERLDLRYHSLSYLCYFRTVLPNETEIIQCHKRVDTEAIEWLTYERIHTATMLKD